MMDAHTILSRRFGELIDKRDGLTRKRNEVNEQLHVTNIELRTVESLLKEISASTELAAAGGIDEAAASEGSGDEAEQKRGPTDAVLWYLERHPHGATTNEIVTAMARKIDTTSSDRKRVLYNTILNLKSRQSIKLIDQDGEKRYIVNVNGHGAE